MAAMAGAARLRALAARPALVTEAGAIVTGAVAAASGGAREELARGSLVAGVTLAHHARRRCRRLVDRDWTVRA